MANILISPGKYVQGPGELKKLGEYAEKYGKKALILITASGFQRIGAIVEGSFLGKEAAAEFDYFNGECSKTEIDRLLNIARDKGCDMIIGYIANDRMFFVLDRFFNGEITDLALINSLSALKLGKQYVALTEKACKKIEVLDERQLTESDRDRLKQESGENRSKGIAMAGEICRKYRRDGRFFDEILKAGE